MAVDLKVTTWMDPSRDEWIASMRCPVCKHGSERHVKKISIARAIGDSFRDRMKTIESARVTAHADCACWACLMRRGKQRQRVRARRERGSEAGE